MVELNRIVEFLDAQLDVARIADDSNNGLQVENSGSVTKVCCGVDASLAFFREAAQRGASLAICHHGLSWGGGFKRITGLTYRRIAFLRQHDLALYACHLPLDLHPTLGNNARICRLLGLRGCKPFGLYHGLQIGFQGSLPAPMRFEAFKSLVARKMGAEVRSMDFGRKTVRTVAVVSGGGSDELEEAALKGIDVFLSGEPKLYVYSLAEEYGINAVFAGHYATEVFGVQALAELLRRRFRIEAEFVNLNVPY